MWEKAVSCRITEVGVFCRGRMERSLFVYLPRCQGTNELSPPIWGLLSPSRLSWCWVSTATEAWNIPGSQAVQFFISLSPVGLDRHVWLAAAYESIQPGTHVHVVNSFMLMHSIQSPSGHFEFFQSRDGKVKGHQQLGWKILVQPFRIQAKKSQFVYIYIYYSV